VAHGQGKKKEPVYCRAGISGERHKPGPVVATAESKHTNTGTVAMSMDYPEKMVSSVSGPYDHIFRIDTGGFRVDRQDAG
jgi:hypothetical protein